MSHPIHLLKHDHRVIEQGLRALEGVCVRFAAGEQVPPAALGRLLDFIQTYADRHHHRREEEMLFPALERCGIPRAGGPLGAMLREHERERGLVEELGREVAAYQAGLPDARWRVVETARQMIELLVAHIQKEDQILFRIAEEVLDDADKEALSREFKQAAAQFGPGVLEQYERIAAELEQEWAA